MFLEHVNVLNNNLPNDCLARPTKASLVLTVTILPTRSSFSIHQRNHYIIYPNQSVGSPIPWELHQHLDPESIHLHWQISLEQWPSHSESCRSCHPLLFFVPIDSSIVLQSWSLPFLMQLHLWQFLCFRSQQFVWDSRLWLYLQQEPLHHQCGQFQWLRRVAYCKIHAVLVLVMYTFWLVLLVDMKLTFYHIHLDQQSPNAPLHLL